MQPPVTDKIVAAAPRPREVHFRQIGGGNREAVEHDGTHVRDDVLATLGVGTDTYGMRLLCMAGQVKTVRVQPGSDSYQFAPSDTLGERMGCVSGP